MSKLKIEVDAKEWAQREKAIRAQIQKNIRNFLNSSAKATHSYATHLTPVGKPITPKGDRPRPGHTYGDLKKGWINLRLQKFQGDSMDEHETGLTHDAIGKNTTGSHILNVLESGAAPHMYHGKNQRYEGRMIFFYEKVQEVVAPYTVRHPGAKPRKLLSKIQEYAYDYMVKHEKDLVGDIG